MSSKDQEFIFLDQLIELCKTKLTGFFPGSPAFDANLVENKLGMFGPWTSIILLSGSDLRLTFKVHFSYVQLREIILGGEAERDRNRDRAKIFDFMKEFCNQYGGAVKRAFGESKVELGISLPMLTRGFDEVFFPRADNKLSFAKFAEIKSSSMDFRTTLFLETPRPDLLRSLKVEFSDAEEGEVEFL